MAFTYDLTTDVGKLRLRVGDSAVNAGPRPTAGASSNFADEELQHFLDTEGSIGKAVALVFETLAAEWAVFTNITIGPRKEELARIADSFMRKALSARQQYGAGSTFSVGWDREDGYSEAAEETTELS